MSFLVRVVVSAVAVWVVTLLLPGVVVEGPPGAMGSTLYEVLTFLAVGLVLALVDAVVRPIVKTLAFPLYVLTLGLFSVVVNAAMLELAAWLLDRTRLTFTIDRFWWTAVLAAVIVSLVSMVLNAVLPDGRDDD
ncbi:phage holin family protein [Angustibacter aerolatus]